MKKNILVAGALLAIAGAAYGAKALDLLNFDFTAPSVPTTSDAPNQVGLIVHSADDNAFYGRGSGSSDWQMLSNDTTAQVPAGTILPFGGTTAPAGYLMTDGSAVSRMTYANLFDAIGTAFGDGDGQDTFNLPDLRGRFLRGQDQGQDIDKEAAGRPECGNGGNAGDLVGSCQDDAFQGHWHQKSSSASIAYGGGGSYNPSSGGSYNVIDSASQVWAHGAITDGANGTPRTAPETRPTNVSVRFIIKY